MKAKWWLLLVALVVVALARSVVFVDETQFVIITLFGRPVSTHRDAGLHLKYPWQSATRIDRRLQIYDPNPSEFLASEKKNVLLDVYLCWKVADPQQFLETVNDLAGAESRLHDTVYSELGDTVGHNPLEALVSEDPARHRLDELMASVARRCAERAKAAYGIEVVDVRLKRIAVPKQVRESVFARMRSERAQIASKYRAEGDEEATKIRADADKQKTLILADAYKQAETTRGRGEAEAARIYAEAHQTDPQFYELLRTLEAYRKFLDEKTTILLSADSDLLKFLTRGTALDDGQKKERQ